jgi:hypothetical protein
MAAEVNKDLKPEGGTAFDERPPKETYGAKHFDLREGEEAECPSRRDTAW